MSKREKASIYVIETYREKLRLGDEDFARTISTSEGFYPWNSFIKNMVKKEEKEKYLFLIIIIARAKNKNEKLLKISGKLHVCLEESACVCRHVVG